MVIIIHTLEISGLYISHPNPRVDNIKPTHKFRSNRNFRQITRTSLMNWPEEEEIENVVAYNTVFDACLRRFIQEYVKWRIMSTPLPTKADLQGLSECR